MHRLPTKRPPAKEKFENQEKFEFLFDMPYDFK